MMLCTVYQLGQVAYSEAYRLQTDLAVKRINDNIGDTLLLLEHPPTITIGKTGSLDNVRVSLAELEQKGVSLFFIERGGDVTYHGPDQLVGYPIISLVERGQDLHRYVNDLEEVIRRMLADFGIETGRDKSHRGVWVANREVAAIGLRVRRWVTLHGFALNVNNDLEPFSLINPCGFSDRGATSISALLGREVEMKTVVEKLLARFAEVFDAQLKLAEGGIEDIALPDNGGDNMPGSSGNSNEKKSAIMV